MVENYKNDLMYVQNELLGDIKNIENKIELKFKKNNQSFEEYKTALDKKMNYLENAYNALLQKAQNTKDKEVLDEKKIYYEINSVNKKLEDNFYIVKNEVNNLRNEIKDNTYKYQKLISDNFQIPGLVGYNSKFTNITQFLQNLNKNFNDLIKAKVKQESDFTKYKEKIYNSLASNRSYFDILENKIINKFELKLKELSQNNTDSIHSLEEKINAMKIENGKFTYDLANQCNDLIDKFNKNDGLLKSTLDNYNSKLIIYQNTFKNVNEKMNKFGEHYQSLDEKLKLIKEQMLRNINMNKINLNITNLDYKIKDLQKQYLTIKNKIKIYEERNERKDFFENFLNSPKLIKSNSIKNSIEIENNSNSVQRNPEIDESKNPPKKNNISEEKKDEFLTTKNIIYNVESYKNPKLSRNILKNKSEKEKFNNSSSRVISGKIFNHFPFVSYAQNNNPENMNNTMSRKKMKILNNSKENIYKKKEEKDLLELLLNHKKNKNIRNRSEKEAKEQNQIQNHSTSYLDKKIDILGKSMIDYFNKIIRQINFLKKIVFNNEKYKTIKLKDSKENNESIKHLNNSTIVSFDKKNLL